MPDRPPVSGEPHPDCTTPRFCAENGCQHTATAQERLRMESWIDDGWGFRVVPLDNAIRALNNTALDVERLAEALIEWKHRGHRIDSNGFCDDCMRFVDLIAAEEAVEIVEADARLRAEQEGEGR